MSTGTANCGTGPVVSRRPRTATGFTLVEIMIVVAIIGLIAVLALPLVLRARKQSQGRRVVNDARIIDAAMDQVAINNNLADGTYVSKNQVAGYMKSAPGGNSSSFWVVLGGGGPLFSGNSWVDVLGNPYLIGPIGTNQVAVNPQTKTALDNVGVDWGTY